MKKRFSEIQSSEDVKKCNSEIREAMCGLPEKDKKDGFEILDLIELERKYGRWYGKLEFPVEPNEVKCSFNIKRGVFHSSQIYIQVGRWRFTRTEFNRSVEFKGEKASEKNCVDSE